MVEKYIDPDTIAQIKAAVEEWLKKTVGNCEDVGTEDGGQVLIMPERLLIQAAYAPFSPPVRGIEAERRDVAHGAGLSPLYSAPRPQLYTSRVYLPAF